MMTRYSTLITFCIELLTFQVASTQPLAPSREGMYLQTGQSESFTFNDSFSSSHATHVAGSERNDNCLKMTFVWCPPGSFLMGSPVHDKYEVGDNAPQHQVTVSKGFWLGKFEVTQAEWSTVMETRPWDGQKNIRERPNHPATYVNWNDAIAFCARLTASERTAARLPANERYALPTEAQWEYACRAWTTTRYNFGDHESQLDKFAWWGSGMDGSALSESFTHQVGKKKPNHWGLHDMHGNAWEWCQDWSGDYETSPAKDPRGPASGTYRTMRGGSFMEGQNNLRTASRGMLEPSERDCQVGFRVMRESE